MYRIRQKCGSLTLNGNVTFPRNSSKSQPFLSLYQQRFRIVLIQRSHRLSQARKGRDWRLAGRRNTVCSGFVKGVVQQINSTMYLKTDRNKESIDSRPWELGSRRLKSMNRRGSASTIFGYSRQLHDRMTFRSI